MINSLFLSELYNAGYPGPSLRTQKTVQVIPYKGFFYCPHNLWATTSTEFCCYTETNATRHFWCMMHLVAFIDWCITGVQMKESLNFNDTTVHLWSWSWSWQWVWAPWSWFLRSCLPIFILNKIYTKNDHGICIGILLSEYFGEIGSVTQARHVAVATGGGEGDACGLYYRVSGLDTVIDWLLSSVFSVD